MNEEELAEVLEEEVTEEHLDEEDEIAAHRGELEAPQIGAVEGFTPLTAAQQSDRLRTIAPQGHLCVLWRDARGEHAWSGTMGWITGSGAKTKYHIHYHTFTDGPPDENNFQPFFDDDGDKVYISSFLPLPPKIGAVKDIFETEHVFCGTRIAEKESPEIIANTHGGNQQPP